MTRASLFGKPGNAKAAFRRLPWQQVAALARLPRLALAGLETRVGLADHENLATTANHLAVAVTGLRRLQGGQVLHGKPRQETVGRGLESVGQKRLDRTAAHFSGVFHDDSSACTSGDASPAT